MRRMAMRGAIALLIMAQFLPGASAASDPPRAARAFAEARRALASGDMAAARIHLRNAVRADPGDAEARHALGSVNLALGDFAAAEKDIRAARRAGLPADRGDADLALALLRQRKFVALLDETSASDAAPRREARLRLLRAAAQAALLNHDEAERELRAALAVAPSAAAHVALGRLALARRDAAGARDAAAAAIALDPGDAEAWVLRGRADRAAGEGPGAAEAFERAIALAPRLVSARLARAGVALAAGDVAAARADADAILAVDPAQPQGLYLRALTAALAGEPARAAEILPRIEAVLGAFPAGRLLAAQVHAALGRPHLAEREINALLAAHPDHRPARRALARLLLLRGEAQAALGALPNGETPDDDGDAHALRGEAMLRLDRWDEAARAFAAAAARGAPEDGRLVVGLAASDLLAGRREDGLRRLEAAIALDPVPTAAIDLLMRLLVEGGETERARAAAGRLRARLPRSPLPDFHLAAIAASEGRRAEAEHALRASLRADPNFKPARMHLAGLLAAAERPDEAAKALRGLLERAGGDGDAEALSALGRLEQRRGDVPRALRWFERAIAADPRAAGPRIALSEALLAQGDPRKALVVARGLLEVAPLDPRGADLMGRIHLASGQPVDAAAMFRRAAAQAPAEPTTWSRLAAALAALGDQPGARGALEEGLRARPDALALWVQRVAIEWRAGGPAAALRAAEELRDRHPGAAAGHLVAGDVRLAAGDRVGATEAYETAFARAPGSDAAARVFDMRLASGAGNAQAVAFARDWLRRHPRDLVIRHRLVALALRAGNTGEAIAELEALIGVAPGDAVALNNLAWLLAAQGDARAVPLAARAHALAPDDPAVADTLGLALLRAGEVVEAVGMLRLALARAPGSAQLRMRLATALAETGAREEARRLAGAALAGGDGFPGRDEARRLLERLGEEGVAPAKTPLAPRARGG
jgi:cellulose synthase operon protein C